MGEVNICIDGGAVNFSGDILSRPYFFIIASYLLVSALNITSSVFTFGILRILDTVIPLFAFLYVEALSSCGEFLPPRSFRSVKLGLSLYGITILFIFYAASPTTLYRGVTFAFCASISSMLNIAVSLRSSVAESGNLAESIVSILYYSLALY